MLTWTPLTVAGIQIDLERNCHSGVCRNPERWWDASIDRSPHILFDEVPRTWVGKPDPKVLFPRLETDLKLPCVYILASKRNGTLYVGVTPNIVQRVWQHKNDFVEGFTKRYAVHTMVWFEVHESMGTVVTREKAIKGWKRAWKLELIEKGNPTWRDLYEEIV